MLNSTGPRPTKAEPLMFILARVSSGSNAHSIRAHAMNKDGAERQLMCTTKHPSESSTFTSPSGQARGPFVGKRAGHSRQPATARPIPGHHGDTDLAGTPGARLSGRILGVAGMGARTAAAEVVAVRGTLRDRSRSAGSAEPTSRMRIASRTLSLIPRSHPHHGP
jgi:hypothetical protein